MTFVTSNLLQESPVSQAAAFLSYQTWDHCMLRGIFVAMLISQY